MLLDYPGKLLYISGNHRKAFFNISTLNLIGLSDWHMESKHGTLHGRVIRGTVDSISDQENRQTIVGGKQKSSRKQQCGKTVMNRRNSE